MAKKKYNSDEAFKGILGLTGEAGTKEESSPVTHEIPAAIKSEPENGRGGKTEKYVRVSFYITPEMKKAIKEKAFYSEMDISEVVRSALGEYLKIVDKEI